MYTVVFFKDKKGNEPVKEYLIGLQEKAQSNKDNRIKLKKIYEYIEILSRNGTMAGEPYIKHIEADIWELRPLSDRIFFFFWQRETRRNLLSGHIRNGFLKENQINEKWNSKRPK